jgi:hypothetical protein
MKKSPLILVNDQFGSKEKLVDALIALPESVFDRGDDDKDAFRKRLLGAANAKLLRLHETGKAVGDRWGSKEKLVDAILNLRKRGKDEDYRTKLSTLPIGKLFDQVSALEKADRKTQRKASGKPLTKPAKPAAKPVVKAVVKPVVKKPGAKKRAK